MRGAAAVLIAAVLLACASSSESAEPADGLVLTGKVVGNGAPPIVTLLFVTETDRYQLVGDLAEEIWRLQQRRVTVRGRVVCRRRGPVSQLNSRWTSTPWYRQPSHEGRARRESSFAAPQSFAGWSIY